MDQRLTLSGFPVGEIFIRRPSNQYWMHRHATPWSRQGQANRVHCRQCVQRFYSGKLAHHFSTFSVVQITNEITHFTS